MCLWLFYYIISTIFKNITIKIKKILWFLKKKSYSLINLVANLLNINVKTNSVLCCY